MPWYSTPDVSGSWRHWAVNEGHIPKRFWHDPERRDKNGWRDIASVFHPAIGPYDSADPHLCEYHILLARLAGIDAFVADWYGPQSYEDKAFSMMRRVAGEIGGFKVMICWEDQACFPPYASVRSRSEALEEAMKNLRFLNETWFSSAAYLRIAGRPVLTNFAWNDPGSDMTKAWAATEWDSILAQAKHRPVFIHDWQSHRKVNEFESYESVMPWGSTYHMENDAPEFWNSADASRGKGRFSFRSGTVLPGFDNRGVGGWGSQGAIGVTPFGDGRKLQATFDACLSRHPQFVQIATWNDFNEGATIEPVRIGVAIPSYPQAGYGYRMLDIVQHNAGLLKNATFDSAALRIPAWIYACRKRAAATGDSAAGSRIDAVRTLLLVGKTAEARTTIEEIYNSFPAKLVTNRDLAAYVEPVDRGAVVDVGWVAEWNVNDCLWRFQKDFEDDQRPPHPGRQWIIGLHPNSKDKPCLLTRAFKPRRDSRLTLSASSTTARPNVADFALRVKIDGKVVHEEVISAGPKPSRHGWKNVSVALGKFAGQEIELAIECASGGKDPWNHEHAFLADVRVR